MVLSWKRAVAVIALALALPCCVAIVPVAPRPDASESAHDVGPLAEDLPAPRDVGAAALDAGHAPPMDAAATPDISPWGAVPEDAPAWPEDVGASVFDNARWGQVPAGGPSLPPFRLPVDVGVAPQVVVSPTGQVWLADVTTARVTHYDGRASRSVITAVTPDGIVAAQLTADGSISVAWIEADAGGALAALRARGPVQLGDLAWTADADGEGVVVRFDTHGSPLWWSRLPGAQVIRGARVEGDRAAVVVAVAGAARLGSETVVGPRHARVDLDVRGAVTALRLLDTATSTVDARALALNDGGTVLAERFGANGTIRAYDHRGALRWSRSGPLEDALFEDDGGVFILSRSELIGVDRDGFVRWRVDRPGFDSYRVGGRELTSRGRELRAAGATIAVLQRLFVTPEWDHLNHSPCYPARPPTNAIEVDYVDRRGRPIPAAYGSWSGGRELAWSAGRTCLLRQDGPADRLGIATPGPGSLACDGTAPQASCTADGFCAPCGADLLADSTNCGACGHRCADAGGTLGRCLRGVCVYDRCDAHHGDCDARPETGCEVDLSRDAANCGACRNACPAGSACESGRCAGTGSIWWSDGRDGDFAPTRDVVLASGVHRFRTITVPAGVTVRTTEGGVLDLRATGDVRVAGTIDLSGGDGEGASPLAAGGSTASAPRGAAGSQGAGPAGGGGRRDADGSGPAPGRRGAPRAFCSHQSGQSAGASCWPATTSLADVSDAYRGDSDVRCLHCLPPGYQGHLCEVEPEGGGGGGSIGQRAVLDLAVASTFAPGSGGGASGNDGGGAGGAGGGALRLSSATRIALDASAALLARGGRGGVPEGGPGSGGVIVLAAPEVRAAAGAIVSAAGGGTNGLGRIRVTADAARCALAGSFVPPLRDGCAATSAMGFTWVSPWR